MRYKMKTLEQLGISPAPWSVDDHNNIRTTDGHTLAATMVSNAYGHDRTEKDAFIIAAAPELYEALVAMLSRAEKEAPFTTGSGMSIAMDMARKALKKAAGESEGKE